MKVQAYVIKGSYSEYSDRCYWTVAVHLDRDNAEQHLVQLLAALKVWESLDRDQREVLSGGEFCAYRTALDSVRGFNESLDSQTYFMEECPLLLEVPDAPLTLRAAEKVATT